jgi:hypothetical protein
MARSRREQILRYADPNYELPPQWQIETMTLIEAKRLAKTAGMARVATDVPRRLGGEASGAELAADKKLSRRVAYVYYSLWTRFVRAEHAPLPVETCPVDLIPPRTWKALHTLALADDEIRRAGSTVIWDEWWAELAPRLHARRMVLASLSLARGDVAWGYRMIVNLTDEINWVSTKFDMYHATLKRVHHV